MLKPFNRICIHTVFIQRRIEIRIQNQFFFWRNKLRKAHRSHAGQKGIHNAFQKNCAIYFVVHSSIHDTIAREQLHRLLSVYLCRYGHSVPSKNVRRKEDKIGSKGKGEKKGRERERKVERQCAINTFITLQESETAFRLASWC